MCDQENVIEGLSPAFSLPEVSFGEVFFENISKHDDEDVALVSRIFGALKIF